MSHIEHCIAQVERWEESIRREQDELARTMADPDRSDVTWNFCAERLAALDVELDRVKRTLADLRAKRFLAELILPVRPRHRMLKARRRLPKRKSA